MQLQTLEQDEIINVRWASEDPNPGVKEKRKRQVENEVLEHVKAQLPRVGERGTVLDYDNLNGNVKKTKQNGQEGDEEWEEYCRQYYEYYGKYPEKEGDKSDGDGKVISDDGGLRDVVGPVKSVVAVKPVVADYDSDSD
jgi:hypothetical protein